MFGNKTGFGGSSSGTLFGSTATSSAPASSSTFGGFGTSNTGGGFGNTNTNTSGGLFGSKPTGTFGSTTANTSSGFGSGLGGASNSGSFGSGTALGAGNLPPSNGTADVPFNPHVEKESAQGGNSTTSNYFQTITMQQPYQKYSQEELRLADYDKGRRYGNAGGGFGQGSNFGGFGTNTGGANTGTLFGSQNNNNSFGNSSTNAFGGSSNTGGGFGANTGGGLFNQQKPAGTGLFGQQSSGTGSGGLFGTSGTNTGGFGGFGGNANNNQPNSSFGQNAQKPGGLFGSTNNTSTGTGLFGQNQPSTNTGGGLFGSNNNSSANTGASAGLFGQSNTNSGGGFGGFGQQNQSQQNKPGSLFGSLNTSTSQPSGGLFGSNNNTNTSGGGGLFGSNNASNTSGGGGLFGAAGNANQSKPGGLFGSSSNDAPKPGGLFGGSTSNTSTAFGGFGNAQGQNTAGGGLFSGTSTNANQQQGGGLFGGTGNAGGSSLFGSNQNKGGSLFGGNTQSQPQNNSLFGSQNNTSSLFGAPQPQQNGQQPQAFHSSLLDGNPYGQSSIWSGLPPATAQNSGPLVTPLSASQRLKERSAQPALKFTPLSASRFMTPPKRTGYGFSYSTYGSPSSAASTPGGGSLTSSMYGKQFSGGSFGRSIGKSFSASNLRQHYSTDGDGVLAPGAFTPSSSRYSSGSIRRLTIDRNLRTESLLTPRALPAPPPATSGVPNGTSNGTGESAPVASGALKDRRVSFAGDTTSREDDDLWKGANGALVRTDNDSAPPGDSKTGTNGAVNGAADQSRGKELAVVPEDQETESITSKMKLPKDAPAAPDQKEGQYYMIPSREELRKLPRDQLQAFKGFRLGRQGCGEICFDHEVDLTTVPLDDLWDKIVVIHIRSITVYPDSATKPPVGKGLNVPSTINMENSWPRNRRGPSPATSGPHYERHIKRLKRLTNCNFISYNDQTGVWTFSVPHYTTYDLDYDDEDDEALDSPLSSVPNTSVVGTTPADSGMDVDEQESSIEDDTFGYKKSLPGAFGKQSEYHQQNSFLGDGSPASDNESVESQDDMSMAGSYPAEARPVEPSPAKLGVENTPGRHLLDLDGDWADQLRRTISPRKQDRQALREAQGRVLADQDLVPIDEQSGKQEFRTSIDVMNSLFGKFEERQQGAKKQGKAGKDFEV